jgi:DNA-binding NarL/FixJ family response regulator
MNDKAIRVLVADDHCLFRQGLLALLQGSDRFDIEVAGEASSGPEAIEKVLVLKPDVLLLDIVMPGMDGIEAARRIAKTPSKTQIVFLTDHHNEAYLRQAFNAGGRAYIHKDSSFNDLLKAIEHAARGDYYLAGPNGQALVVDYVHAVVRRQKPGGIMTRREREIAVLLADGYSTKEAAAVLDISARTAEAHRASVMRKLDARNVADVVKYCIRNHLIDM